MAAALKILSLYVRDRIAFLDFVSGPPRHTHPDICSNFCREQSECFCHSLKFMAGRMMITRQNCQEKP